MRGGSDWGFRVHGLGFFGVRTRGTRGGSGTVDERRRTDGRSARGVRSAPAGDATGGRARTWRRVKLLIRASGVFLSTNFPKSGWRLHRAMTSPKRNPDANDCAAGGEEGAARSIIGSARCRGRKGRRDGRTNDGRRAGRRDVASPSEDGVAARWAASRASARPRPGAKRGRRRRRGGAERSAFTVVVARSRNYRSHEWGGRASTRPRAPSRANPAAVARRRPRGAIS